jgi:hypothetical protein
LKGHVVVEKAEQPSLKGTIVLILFLGLAIFVRWYSTGQWIHPYYPG